MLTRSCPKCTTEMSYQSKGAYKTATDRNSTCRKCASKASGFTDRYATKGANTGDSNAFYGKKHSKETTKRLSVARTGRKHSEEAKRKVSVNNGRGMTGRSVYDVWLQKHGKKRADELLKLKKKRNSIASKGNNNPMYGKPAPSGSGYGWKGWYNGAYFRSLRELSFMIANKDWKSAEYIRIDYKYNDSERTYRPDFIINNRVIEVKPKRLHDTALIQAKAKAATKHCSKLGMTYELIDQEIVKFETLDRLVTNKEVIWHDRYKTRFEIYKETLYAKGNQRVG